MTQAARNYTMDAIKALAIFLVVYCHCIKYIGDYDYWNNPIWQVIYTFHMPLFFVVSGFFFPSALKLGWKDFLLRKSIALMLPCLVWTILFSCMHFPGWSAFLHKVANPFHWDLWFLKGLFLVQLVEYTLIKITKHLKLRHPLWIAATLSMVVYFLPFMSVPRVMIPMLWIGYFIRVHYDWFRKHYLWIALIAITGYLILFPYWTSEIQEMYGGANVKIISVLLGKTDVGMLIKLGYRILIGAFGSVAIIAALHVLKKVPQWISVMGSSTAAIYILQSLVLEDLIGNHVAPYSSFISICPGWVVFSVIYLIITMLMIFLCIGLRWLIDKNMVLSMMLLGNTSICKK